MFFKHALARISSCAKLIPDRQSLEEVGQLNTNPWYFKIQCFLRLVTSMPKDSKFDFKLAVITR